MGAYGLAGKIAHRAAAVAAEILSPAWLRVARGEERQHVAEYPGYRRNHPRILAYLATVPGLRHIPVRGARRYVMAEVDETAWCGCFVNWCLIQAGYPPYRQAAGARRWLSWGQPLDSPLPGAITVLFHHPRRRLRSTTISGFHVGFFVGDSADDVRLLGGNQGDRVCERSFSSWRVMGWRWPERPEIPGEHGLRT